MKGLYFNIAGPIEIVGMLYRMESLSERDNSIIITEVFSMASTLVNLLSPYFIPQTYGISLQQGV
jgi:hypothetical protein